MKVEIIKAEKPTYWYADCVGATFDVVDYTSTDYVLVEDHSFPEDVMWRHISKDDCKILKDG